MVCGRCGKKNETGSQFCEKCGNPLTAESSERIPALVNAEDIPPVRPLTNLAYKIYDSENKSLIRSFLYLVFAALAVGTIAILFTLKDEVSKMISLLSFGGRAETIEEMEIVRGNAANGAWQAVLILILLLIASVILYIFIGRLLARLRKVSLKEKKLMQARRENLRAEAIISGGERKALKSGSE